jgi:hypothetical protein
MMANNDDMNQQYPQGDPDQWTPQQPGIPGQDPSTASSAPYGLAGQGQMGDAMSRDVDPNMAGQMDQDQYQQQAGQMGQDPYQQSNVGQDPYQQGNVGQDPYQQGNVGQPNQQQDDWDDQGMMAGGYGGNQPNPNQAGQQNITPAQGAPMQPNAPSGQPPVGDPGMLGNARQRAEQQADSAIDQFADRVPGGEKHAQQAKDAVSDQMDNLEDQAQGRSGGGLGEKLGHLFGRHDDQDTPPDQGNM